MRSSVSSRRVPSSFMKIGAWNISPTFSSSVMRTSSSSTRSSMPAAVTAPILSRATALSARFAEGDEPSALVVPELEPRRMKAVAEGELSHVHRLRRLIVRGLEVVIGDTCTQVMDVVETDVAGEVLQQPRQLQVGASVHRCLVVAPFLVRLPVGVLELVLHVEKPDPDDSGDHEHRPLHEEERAPTDEEARGRDDNREREVGGEDAVAHALRRATRHEPRLQDEHEHPAETEHHEWVAEKAIAEAPPAAERPVLVDGQRRDVTDAAAVEVARRRVMD